MNLIYHFKLILIFSILINLLPIFMNLNLLKNYYYNKNLNNLIKKKMSTTTTTTSSNINNQYLKELNIAKLAVRRASILSKKISDEIKLNQIDGINKNDNSPVTIGDFGSQSIIINSILKNFPNDLIVGEEDSKLIKSDKSLSESIFKHIKLIESLDSKNNEILGEINSIDHMCDSIDNGNSKGGPNGRIWALDPIDGTKGFLRGDQFAVCLALIVDGKVKLGVIGCPNLPNDLSNDSLSSSSAKNTEKGGIFYATENNGSFYQPLTIDFESKEYEEIDDSKAVKISLNNNKSFENAIVCEGVEKGHSSHNLQSLIKSNLNINSNSLHLDSQAKYCALSRGDAEIYLRLPKDLNYREKIWDHAAGNILIKESFGIVTDIFGNELDFGCGRTLNSLGIIASSKNLHSDIIKTVKSIIGENGENLNEYL